MFKKKIKSTISLDLHAIVVRIDKSDFTSDYEIFAFLWGEKLGNCNVMAMFAKVIGRDCVRLISGVISWALLPRAVLKTQIYWSDVF